MSLISIIGTPLYQWETGRKLKVIPLRGMRVDSVHISNYGDKTALVVKPREENGAYIADIPNILLQDDRSIAVYSVNVSEDKTETLRECVFSIRKRAKPSDYIYTETEVFTYKALEERLNKIEENGVDEDQIAEAVKDYFEQNPFTESDPSVPDWAKNPEKPTYTADEVGALPKNGDSTANPTVNSLTVKERLWCSMLRITEMSDRTLPPVDLWIVRENSTTPYYLRFARVGKDVVIGGIADPERDNDAATKGFVARMIDEAFGGLINGKY